MCTARALATSVLVGMQPTLTQVPPRSLRSISAVLIPSLSRRAQSAGAACPVPITMASKRSDMRLLLGRSAILAVAVLHPHCVRAPRERRNHHQHRNRMRAAADRLGAAQQAEIAEDVDEIVRAVVS